jgi:uncharacterized protein YcfL
MKKIIFLAVAAIALIACNKTTDTSTVDSTTKVDTIKKIDTVKKVDTIKKVDTTKKAVAATVVKHKHVKK